MNLLAVLSGSSRAATGNVSPVTGSVTSTMTAGMVQTRRDAAQAVLGQPLPHSPAALPSRNRALKERPPRASGHGGSAMVKLIAPVAAMKDHVQVTKQTKITFPSPPPFFLSPIFLPSDNAWLVSFVHSL